MGVSLVLMDEALAAQIVGPQLKPRLILAGAHAGAFALSPAVLADERHAAVHGLLTNLPRVTLSPDEAWPETD
ncbi:hypothetical protein [Phenylobacterium sp.]|uniref:hypothetical protein n=1 Tax=Phenylobacterium sp. TaxID=1871053 RepID=UPI0027322AF7|nr:hypothetical protein [Phenylobacterium sp.]MDP1616787.1 hypothetical protein [Phenylobacterium sp.]